MTDSEILTLVDQLAHCLLRKDAFHHRDHLAVAVVYLYTNDLQLAVERMRASLVTFAAHHKVSGLYHETLTRFWLQQVDARLDRALCLSESVRSMQAQFADKNLPFAYYSKERIESQEARQRYVEPDIARRD